MDKNRKTLLVTMALVLFGILLLAFVFATTNENIKTTGVNSPQIIQTYTTYDKNETVYYQVNPVQTYYLNKHEENSRHYYLKNSSSYTMKQANTVRYTQYGVEDIKESFLGDYIKKYSVNVTNRGIVGRYFTVTFNLQDKNGYEFSQSVTLYLRDGESKEFVYKDIQYERNEILNWNYDITTQDY